MWPCGVIVNVAEMLSCESKSQVYGHVHSTLELESMVDVGEYSYLLVHLICVYAEKQVVSNFTSWDIAQILQYIRASTFDLFLGTICYDDACHLLRYAQNKKRKDATDISKRISQMNIVVDKFHYRNHVDKWCQSNCNPYNWKDLEGVSKATGTCDA